MDYTPDQFYAILIFGLALFGLICYTATRDYTDED